MKKKLLALVCALALTVSLVGCALSTPDTVGKIGDFEVTSGLYLLAQYDAYQQAAQLAGSEQDASKVKSFLKATITTDADTGETAVVKDYVAQKTLETLQTLAAVDARFTELGGELTEEQKSAADSYAQQLMDNYGDAYTANGIGLETLKLFQQLQYKHTLLLDLVYGKDGETPVEDGELTEHLDSTMYEIGFITVPLYNTSTFAFASDDQKAEMLSLAQKAADSYNAAAPEDTSSQLTTFNSIASSALTDICAVLDDALAAYNTMRAVEGEKLALDVSSRVDTIEETVSKVEAQSPQTVAAYRQRLEAKMQEVLQSTTIDESRILTEAAIFADKVAVDEETVRLRSHIAQLRDMLQSGEPVGRKLDFLIQEVNRECNTIGSKCNDLTVARDVVNMKAEVEKIREQVQNME